MWRNGCKRPQRINAADSGKRATAISLPSSKKLQGTLIKRGARWSVAASFVGAAAVGATERVRGRKGEFTSGRVAWTPTFLILHRTDRFDRVQKLETPSASGGIILARLVDLFVLIVLGPATMTAQYDLHHQPFSYRSVVVISRKVNIAFKVFSEVNWRNNYEWSQLCMYLSKPSKLLSRGSRSSVVNSMLTSNPLSLKGQLDPHPSKRSCVRGAYHSGVMLWWITQFPLPPPLSILPSETLGGSILFAPLIFQHIQKRGSSVFFPAWALQERRSRVGRWMLIYQFALPPGQA